MGRIALAAWGTRGDCQAIATVAGSLQRRGHDTVFAAPAFMHPEATRLGVEFHPLGDDPVAWFDEKPARRNADPRRVLPGLLRLFARQVDRQFAGLAPLVEGADVVVGQALSYAAPSLAESRGVPYLYLSPNPFFFESAHHPSLGINRAGMPPWVNRLTWKQFSITYNVMFRRRINQHRRRLGMRGVDDVRSHVFDPRTSIAILDPEIYPVAKDVPLPQPPVGSIPVPSDSADLDPTTTAFLEAPGRVVFVDFGSMPDQDPARTSRTVVDATRSVGARVVVSEGWAGLGRDLPASDDVHLVRALPHSSVFPKVDVVVHHGGVGTAATAARAGVVQVVVPHGYDQHASARCIHAAGVAPSALPRRHLNPEALADRLRAALTDREMCERAKTIGDAISSRDPLAMVVREVERRTEPEAQR